MKLAVIYQPSLPASASPYRLRDEKGRELDWGNAFLDAQRLRQLSLRSLRAYAYDDLLDFARPTPLEVLPMGLRGTVDAALRLAAVQVRFKGIEVEIELLPDLPPVLADERHLSQVILNLLLNAGDAMRGSGRVTVAAVRQGDQVALTVSDTGPGIPAEDLPRIFDPFFTTKEPGQGSGLGLAICHSIVESMGGTIDASNLPTGGAAFVVRLRVAC